MKAISATALFLLCAACGPVTSRAPIHSTPEAATACVGDLLASMGYDLIETEPMLRAERPKHAAFGHQRADYDRVTVAVDAKQLRVRGETVAMSGGAPGLARSSRAVSSPGGATITRPSKQLRVDVQRIAAECGGGS